MKKTISQIINETKSLILKGNEESLINKYSLKDRDYRGRRFKDNKKELFGFYNILSLTKPNTISEVHERYLKAGIDIIVTNSLKSNRLTLKDYDLEDLTYELNLASAKLARDKVSKYTSITWDKPRFAAGGISNVPDNTNFELAESVYSEQIKALIAGKVDIIFFKNLENEVSLKAGLSAYNKLMTRRKKIGEVIVSVNKQSLDRIILSNKLIKEFDKLNFIGIGYNFDVKDETCIQSTEALTKIYNSIICSFNSDDENYNKADFTEKYKTLIENEKVKIIGFDNNFYPDFCSELIK